MSTFGRSYQLIESVGKVAIPWDPRKVVADNRRNLLSLLRVMIPEKL